MGRHVHLGGGKGAWPGQGGEAQVCSACEPHGGLCLEGPDVICILGSSSWLLYGRSLWNAGQLESCHGYPGGGHWDRQTWK